MTDFIGNKTAEHYSWTIVAAPVNTEAPKVEAVLSADGFVGNADELTCNTGKWTGAPTFTYQWEENSGGGFEAIPGATSSTLTTTETLNHDSVRCTVNGTNPAGEASKESDNQVRVEISKPKVEITTKPPLRTKSTEAEFAFVAESTVATNGAIHGADPAMPCENRAVGPSFNCHLQIKTQCSLDGAELKSCTSPIGYEELTVGEHTFEVVGVDAIGNTSTAKYSWTVVGPPENTSGPQVTGGHRGYVTAPATLTCDPGSWTGGEEDEYSYQWFESTAAEPLPTATPGATASTLATTAAMVGSKLTCSVTVKNIAGELSRSSINYVIVENAAPKLALTTKPARTHHLYERRIRIYCGNRLAPACRRARRSSWRLRLRLRHSRRRWLRGRTRTQARMSFGYCRAQDLHEPAEPHRTVRGRAYFSKLSRPTLLVTPQA